MAKQSAGILLYRYKNDELQLLLVHPGGNIYKNRDLGWWSIPKGEFIEEDGLVAAKREFIEEVGLPLPDNSKFIPLSPVKQSNKTVFAWAAKGDLDPANIKSNTFTSKFGTYPEIDKAEWFSTSTAKKKILPAQQSFISELVKKLKSEDQEQS
jgi:predicted NUDIX family NTP pyrophosphohydrolase